MIMRAPQRRYIISAILIVGILIGIYWYWFRDSHTFVLTDEPAADSYLKSEQIEPVFGSVRVWGTQDTDVWFTDTANPDVQYQIGYITPGMTETVKLERGHWYIVHGAGEITIRMVNVRIQ